jgi:hypothetical protein
VQAHVLDEVLNSEPTKKLQSSIMPTDNRFYNSDNQSIDSKYSDLSDLEEDKFEAYIKAIVRRRTENQNPNRISRQLSRARCISNKDESPTKKKDKDGNTMLDQQPLSMFFDRKEPLKLTGGGGGSDSHTNSSEGYSDSSSDIVSDNEIRKKIERKFGRVNPDDSKASVSNSRGIKPIFNALGNWSKRFSVMADVGGLGKLNGTNPGGANLQKQGNLSNSFFITHNSTIFYIKHGETTDGCTWRVGQEILSSYAFRIGRGPFPQSLRRSDSFPILEKRN